MEAPPGPFVAERGPQPYAYVCHASIDAYRVYEIIGQLHLDGFRIWYFEDGMKADPSWPEQNAEAIDGCTVFIIFTSAVSVSRPITMDELTLAHNANKPLLQIQLEDINMPRGMAMFLERPQAIMAWRKDRLSVVKEAEEFLRAQGLEPSSGAVADRPVAAPPVSKVGMPPRSHGERPVSISDTFANRVNESGLLAAAVGRQLARLRGDEVIEQDVFPHVLVFHGRRGLGKTGLSRRLETWAAGKPLDHNEWGAWPHRPITPVRWNFNDSAGGVRLDALLVVLREALAETGVIPMAFDLALASYLEAVRPGSDASGLSLSGGAADGVLRSLQRIAVELTLSVPGTLTASEVRRLRDGVLGAGDRRDLQKFDGLPILLEQIRQLPQGTQSAERVADLMYVLTQELFYINQVAEPPLLVFFLDTFERLLRQDSRFAESAITSLIASMPYGLFVITSQDALDWHEPNRTYLEYCGPHAWPGLASGEGQHMLDRLSDEDTRRLYTTHRSINRWQMSDELIEQLVHRSNGWPMHIEAVMQLARSLESQQQGRVLTAADLDRELPQVVTGLMETLDARERNAFRAACVLPFFDVELAAAVMAGDGLDREGAVAGAIRHALVESNPGSLYPYRIHDEVREQVRRDRETPGFWGDGDWRAAAMRGLDEAKRRIGDCHVHHADAAEVEAIALAIRLVYDWDLPIDGLPLMVTEGPTIGGLATRLPPLPDCTPSTPAVGLIRFVVTHAMPIGASIPVFDALYQEYKHNPDLAYAIGRFYAYRLRVLGRYDEALAIFSELIEAGVGDPNVLQEQYAGTRQCAVGDAEGCIVLQAWGDVTGQQTLWDQFAATFPDLAQGLTFQAISAGASDWDTVAKLRLQLSYGQDVPDVVQINYSAVAEFARAGVLADLGDLLSSYSGNVTQAAQTLMKYDGAVVAIPFEVKEKLWFYRSDLFQAAGIDSTKVLTQQDFIDAGRKLRASSPKSYIWNLGPNPQQYQWSMIDSGNGAQYSTQSPCAFTVGSDPGVAAAFQAIKDLRKSGVVADIDDFTPEWQTALADGTIASTLSASWMPQFLHKYAPDQAGKWAVTVWPEIGGAKGGSEAGGSVFIIPKASQHKARAVAFLANMLMSKQGAAVYVAADPAYIPNVVELLNDPAVRNNAYFGTSLIDAFLAANQDYKLFPFDPAWMIETTVLSEQLAKYLASFDPSPAVFLQAAQTQLESQIGCPW